jgi:glutaconyl-CoA/methylmalonyl-CoA decarboxylase subunit gamma
MQRRFRITVEGRAYEVIVEELPHESAAPAPGILSAGTPATQPAPSPASAAHAQPEAGPGDEIAPLAGAVQSIDVALGETVRTGDKIATIEAMKMKTDVFARGSGKVVAIAVKPGDAVDTGAVLITLA